MTGLRVSLLLSALLLAACHRNTAAGTLEQKLIFTANGSYDAQADHRDRIAGGLRQVVWTSRPPLDAGPMTVTYDGDSRAQAWELVIQAPKFTAQDAAGARARTVDTAGGPGMRPAPSSGLKDVLVLQEGGDLRLVTRGYAAQRDPALLDAFR